ncbi:hypothetical protein [Acidithiobacillus ferrianus]|uniref:hypothetical protein n=1 Tax=Acidithiobacillus ferrianus TaxID=2678518 RepID=UPI0034E37726
MNKQIGMVITRKRQSIMADSYLANAELAIVESTETGLFYGAVYRNHPTPSGSDRWLLSITMNEGFLSQRKAAIAANKAFPEIKPLELPAVSDDDACSMDVSLPIGALLTHLTPNKKRLGDREPQIVEVRQYNAFDAPLLDIQITPRQLTWLARTGRVEHDSSSGNDPELNYRYDYYLAVPTGIDSVVA